MGTRGLIFDLDGTLVDSGLDFDAMRREMGLPDRQPILEALAELPGPEAQRCREILANHEQAGAAGATLMPGVVEFLDLLAERGLLQAVVTRNSRESALGVLERLALRFDPVICREDGPVKPDPAAIWTICRRWNVEPTEVVVVGDYVFDMEAGRRAGARTVLYTAGIAGDEVAFSAQADFVLRCFTDVAPLFDWLTA